MSADDPDAVKKRLTVLNDVPLILITEQALDIANSLPFICTPQNYLEKKMLNDEIVNEVRAIRDVHAAKFGYDLRAIYADLNKSEAEHIAAVHSYIPVSERPAPDTALQRSRFDHPEFRR